MARAGAVASADGEAPPAASETRSHQAPGLGDWQVNGPAPAPPASRARPRRQMSHNQNLGR